MENLSQKLGVDEQACSNCGSVFQSILSYRLVKGDEINIMQSIECHTCKNKWNVIGLIKSPGIWRSIDISE